ncbi:MAG: exosortase system-associated protein, TIGR04073 family, partial [Methylovulum sp.]|nr:exosortase system-associated protein, TIGR04073 family [Methylovulum sp.]
PLYVWDDFDKDTSYGSFFRSDACPPGSDRVIATPDAVSATKNPPAVIVPSRQVLDSTGADNTQTNRKLDTIFKKQMMK